MLLQISLFIINFNIVFGKDVSVNVLTNNFFENLQGDPLLITDNSLNENSKHFIEKQIENYVRLVTQEDVVPTKRKRSLLENFTKDITGTYLLSGLSPLLTIPARFPVDIKLFEQNSEWYAAALESKDVRSEADCLAIFHYKNGSFTEKSRTSVSNGVKLATINTENVTLIAVAENDTSKDNFHEKSGIYQFSDSGLVKIQTMNMHHASDIVMWKIHNEIYMSIVQFMLNKTGNIHYEIPIYKWLGKHFDMVQSIIGNRVRKITPFTADHLNFLAIANYIDERGNSKIYSEIYKYDYHLDKYNLHQRILTRACTDIEFFTFLNYNRNKDYFLITANSYEEDFDGSINYEPYSIIYKLVDDYFIPFQTLQLNAVEKWLPIQGPSQEIILFAFCRFEGIKIFQFDGWSFKEVFPKRNELVFGTGIKSMRFAVFDNRSTLVLANKNSNGNYVNGFELRYEYHNSVNEIYDQMTKWCDDGLKKMEAISGGAIFEVILGKPERADVDEEHTQTEMDEKIESVYNDIDSLSSLLKENQSSKKFEVIPDITFNEVIFNDSAFIRHIKTDKINNMETNKLLENVLDIHEGFELSQINFTSVTTEFLSKKRINNQNPATLIHRFDEINLNHLIVNGSVFANNTNLGEQLNGMIIDDLLLIEGNQTFSKPLNLNKIEVNELNVHSLNERGLSSKSQWEEDYVDANKIEYLRVKNLTIGGYINDVDIPVLQKYVLKKSGNQEITGDYSFEVLEGSNLEVTSEIVGKKLSHLIPTDEGDYNINEDLIFTNDLTVNNLEVVDTLNQIKVDDGKLDILVKDSSQEQEISGRKIFDDLVIHSAIYLQGNIKSDELEKMNPMITIENNVDLEGDFTITGNVQVENLISAADVVTSSYSLTKLENEGIKLTEKEVQPRLRFIQQLNANEIFVSAINDRDPGNFVVIGSEEIQIIQGSKTFLSDLHITGATSAFKINEVNVEELENKVLKLKGDQIITGKHHVKNIIVDRLTSNGTNFGNSVWNDVDNAKIKSEITKTGNEFKTKTLKTRSIFVKGLVNGLNFDEIIKDSVMKDTTSTISGKKIIDNITADILESRNDIMEKISYNTDQLRLNGSQRIREIQVENIHFEEQLNQIDRDNFGKDEFDEMGNRIVKGDHSFDTIIILAPVFIASDEINNVNMNELVNNTVKIDELFNFKAATFVSTVIAKKPILLEGSIENFDFDNLIFSGFDSEQIIFDEKTFRNNLTINGTSTFTSFNNINLTKFCEFTMGEIESKNLTIDGNAIFVKGPNVGYINDVDISFIWNNAWFNDKNTVLTGYVEFGEVLFKNDIQVKGFVDNVSLKLLSENYFSKTKDQEITASLTFHSSLIFEKELSSPKMTVNGEINGINLDAFIRTVLLNNTDQVFESSLYLEKCVVKNMTGQFSVNDLNIDQDVMRHDKPNLVTGTKTFERLNTESLKLNKNIKIQDVDVLHWFKDSVLKTASCNITGTKILQNTLFTKGLQLMGSLNNKTFDSNNVMIKNIPQNITGKKIIFTSILDPVSFKVVKLKGWLNGIDMSDLIKNQAYRNEDNIFKTELHLYNNVSVNNIVIKKSYQGVNVTELLLNVTNLGALNNLLEEYKKLQIMSLKLEDSVKAQAYFVHHYKIIQTIPRITNSIKITLPDGNTKIGTLTSDGTNVKMDFYVWDEEVKQLKNDDSINFGSKYIRYASQVLMGLYLYTESNDGLGYFTHMKHPENVITIPTNYTRSTTSFITPSRKEVCTLFVYFECEPKIFCIINDEIKLSGSLKAAKAFEASSITIADTLYLILINEPTAGVESRTDLWRLNNRTNTFQIQQSLFETQPKSISTAYYHGNYYLALASGHLQNAMYSGRVELKRFDATTHKFLPFQSLELDAPVQVQFSIFPSDELVLYVLTDNPTEPLLVFRYEGIAGFKLSVLGSTLPKILYINQFMGAANRHLIVAQNADEINVIQAVFKGEKLSDGGMM